ncbi:MAG: hypothetical protein ACI8RE_002450, partial [Ilumatobacter sp.]
TMSIGAHAYVAKSGVGVASFIGPEDYTAQPRDRAVCSTAPLSDPPAGSVPADRRCQLSPPANSSRSDSDAAGGSWQAGSHSGEGVDIESAQAGGPARSGESAGRLVGRSEVPGTAQSPRYVKRSVPASRPRRHQTDRLTRATTDSVAGGLMLPWSRGVQSPA